MYGMYARMYTLHPRLPACTYVRDACTYVCMYTVTVTVTVIVTANLITNINNEITKYQYDRNNPCACMVCMYVHSNNQYQ